MIALYVQPTLVQDGSMLAGWGSRLPGVERQAQAHVHEFGAHKFHDGDGLWQSGLMRTLFSCSQIAIR